MPDTLIRNLPEAHHAALKEKARQAGLTLNEYLLKIISDVVDDFDPEIVLGFVELKSPEFEADEVDCPSCGNPLARPHLGYYGNLAPFGPVCWQCATTE